MKFGDYFKIIKSNFRKSIGQDDLCRTLFGSVIIPLDLRSDKGDILDYNPGRISEFISNTRPIPEKIRDNIYEDAVTETITTYFEKEIVAHLVPDKSDICHQIMKLVDADPAISDENKSRLRMLANPETVAAFLAQTFAYAIRGDNAVISTGISKGNESAVKSSLHLVGIRTSHIERDNYIIEPFSPVIGNSTEDRYNIVDNLFQKISDIHLGEPKKAPPLDFFPIAKKEPIRISEDDLKKLKRIAEYRHIDIPDDFFNLGDLSVDPLKSIHLINGGSNIDGSEAAIKKYRLIKKLLNIIDDASSRFYIEDIFKNYNCIRLAIQNSGNCADQDITVTIVVPAGSIIQPSELMQLDHDALDDLLSDFDAFEFFGIKRSNDYLDYESSVRNKNTSPVSLPITLPFGGSSRRTPEELLEDYSAVFDYYYDQSGDNMLITLDYDEIMHNTAVAFPTVLLLNKDFKLIKYTIRSRNMPEVYSGSITLAD